MLHFINILNGRELATLIWLIGLSIFALSKKNIRIAINGLLHAFFIKKILVIQVLSLAYIGIVFYLLSILSIWDLSLTKDAIYWFIGTGLVILFNTNNATQDNRFFNKVLRETLRVTIIFEFIVNLYSFNLIVELIQLPLVALVIMMDVIVKQDEKLKLLRKPIDTSLSLYGFGLLGYSIYVMVHDFVNFASIHNIKAFILPIILTLSYLPFIYLFALVMAYESLFIRIKWSLKNDALYKFAKLKILRQFSFKLSELNNFARSEVNSFWHIKTKEQLIDILKETK